MQWRPVFLAEVSETLQQLGMRACPVCGSAESLTIGRSPALLVDAGFPPGNDDPLLAKDSGGMTFAVRVECTTCGHHPDGASRYNEVKRSWRGSRLGLFVVLNYSCL